jgi:glycine cleavage system H protein
MAKPEESRHMVVPAGELKCVWMTAGILSFQLCERSMECETCALDSAVRMHFTPPSGAADGATAGDAAEAVVPAGLAAAGRPARLPADRVYSRAHCWVRTQQSLPERRRLVRVGLEPGLADTLLMPKAVVMPGVGEYVKCGRAHLWVVTDGGTYALPSPADGAITAVNTELARRPHVLASSPLDEGWLFEMEAGEAEIRGADLMAPGDAREVFAADQERFQQRLADALQGGRPRVGATLTDGGATLQHVADMLGPPRYFTLLRQSFR